INAMTLGTRRFQRAVSAKDLLIGIYRHRTGGDARPGLVPLDSSSAETARWKRRVPSVPQCEIRSDIRPIPDSAKSLKYRDRHSAVWNETRDGISRLFS